MAELERNTRAGVSGPCLATVAGTPAGSYFRLWPNKHTRAAMRQGHSLPLSEVRRPNQSPAGGNHWDEGGSAAPLALLRQPTPQEAMLEPMRAFPSWFLRIECERCGKTTMLNEAHMTAPRRGIVLRR